MNLDVIQRKIDENFIDPAKTITLRTLVASGALSSNVGDGVKLLARGELKQPIDIEVTRASESAIEKVEKAGGTVTAVWHNALGIRALLKPYKFDILPRQARPPPKYMEYYTSNESRGYLSPLVQMRKLGLKYEPVELLPEEPVETSAKDKSEGKGKKKNVNKDAKPQASA